MRRVASAIAVLSAMTRLGAGVAAGAEGSLPEQESGAALPCHRRSPVAKRG
jgi:hypothetical protein